MPNTNKKINKKSTKLKVKSKKVSNSESLFEKSFVNSSVGMALVSLDGKFVKINKALLLMLGYTKSQLLKSDLYEIIHPADLDRDADLLKKCLVSGKDGCEVDRRLSLKNKVIYSRIHASLVRDRAGKPTSFILQIENKKNFYSDHRTIAKLRGREYKILYHFHTEIVFLFIIFLGLFAIKLSLEYDDYLLRFKIVKPVNVNIPQSNFDFIEEMSDNEKVVKSTSTDGNFSTGSINLFINTKTFVEIVDTGTGFLNIRSGPGTNYSIIRKANVGERFEVLEYNREYGWYEVDLGLGSKGWLTDQYLKVINVF